MRRWLAVVVLLALLGPAGVQAEKPRRPFKPAAAALYEKAKKLYKAQRYEAASEKFRKAHEIDPQPVFLFNWAQSERMRGDCETAVRLYRLFLETEPSKRAAEAAEQAIALCKEQAPKAPPPPAPPPPKAAPPPVAPPPPAAPVAPPPKAAPPPVAPPPPKAAPPPVVPPPPAPTPPPPKAAPPPVAPPPPPPPIVEPSAPPPPPGSWIRDPAGGVLLAAGVVALSVGGGYYASSVSKEDSARRALTYDRQQQALDDASTARLVGAVTLAVGATLVVAGVMRYLRRWRAERVRVALLAPNRYHVALLLDAEF